MALIRIIGKVIDEVDNSGLPSVNCKITPSGNNTIGFATDFDGNFDETLNLLVTTYDFTFTSVGYGDKIIKKQILSTTQELNLGTIKLKEVSEELEEFVKETFEVIGKVFNENNEPIPGATIKQSNKDISAKSQPNGDFKIFIEYLQSEIPFNLDISAQNYGSETKNLFRGDKTLIDNVNVIILKSTKADLKDEIDKDKPLSNPQRKTLQISKTNFEMAQQQALNKLIETMKYVLLPAILTQIAQFGITKASEALNKKFGDLNAVCPPNLEALNDLIRRKNKLTKQLNNIYKFLNTVKVGVEILDGVLTVAQIAVGVAKALTFIPITPVTPLPTSTASVVEKIDREIQKYQLVSSSTLLVLVILIELLNKIIQYLSLLDKLIQGCAENGSIEGEILSQEQLSRDLLEATQEQSQQLSPVVTNVNGFEMDVIDVDNVTIGELKRRRAVARNRQGVIMLQGEPSFSSNDQILIDELVFYIQQNDLKAD